MKLAVCAQEESLAAEVDQRFGRCPCFVVVDSESGDMIDSICNVHAEAAGGAGPQCTQLLAESGVEAVALGNVGPKAATALEAAKIMIYTGVEGTVENTVQRFNEGKLSPVSQATVSAHSGLRGKR